MLTRSQNPPKTKEGEAIKREVTVFANVEHGQGVVQSGWTYSDGAGGYSNKPTYQFCQYMYDEHVIRIATDRVPDNRQQRKVPDFQQALAKCQWTN